MSLYMHQLSDNESESHQSEPEEVEEDNYSVNDNDNDEHALEAVSYTHLTLPTILLV